MKKKKPNERGFCQNYWSKVLARDPIKLILTRWCSRFKWTEILHVNFFSYIRLYEFYLSSKRFDTHCFDSIENKLSITMHM